MDTPIDARRLAPTTDNRWGAHFRATLALGIPLIGAQLAQLGINTTDVMIVGRLGAEHLAAMVLAAQFLFTILIFGSGFAIAVIPMVAQAYGRGDLISVRRSLRMGLWVVIAYWVIMQPAFFNSEQVLLFAQQKPEVAKLAHGYIMIGQFGVLPALLFNVMRALVSAIGKAGIILKVTIATLVMNAIFAYILVLGHFGFPAMGLEGAAIVSVVVQTAGFLFILAFVQRRQETRRYEIFVRFWKPDWHALLEVIRLGFPISVTILAEVSLFTVASLLMGYIGTIELAAHGIALQWASIAFMIPLGLSQAATVRVGVAHGQGDYQGLVRASITVLVLACAISAVGSVLFATMPQFLGSWFLDVNSPEAPGACLCRAADHRCRAIPARRRAAGDRQWIAARPQGRPRADDHGVDCLLADRLLPRLGLCFPVGFRRHRHLVRLPRRAGSRRRHALRALLPSPSPRRSDGRRLERDDFRPRRLNIIPF